MTSEHVAGCYSCEQEPVGPQTRPSERIFVGPGWRVVHAIHSALPGWLVLVPRRHVETMADLTEDEAVELGRLQVAASRALHEVLGCTKTYVVQFAEAEGFAHTHVHVIPRAAGMPEGRIGPAVFGYLGGPEATWTSQSAMDALAAQLAPVIERGANT